MIDGSARKGIRAVIVLVGITIGSNHAIAQQADAADVDEQTREIVRRWFFMIGAANAHPKLESEDLIRNYFDPLTDFIAPGHDEVFTVGDLRDMWLLWPPFVGLGYNINDKWSLTWQAGYSSGKVRTEDTTSPSIILLPFHSDFEIKRGAFYSSLGLDYYPFGMASPDQYDRFIDRMKASRLFVGGRLTYTYALYEAKVKMGFKPFRNFVNIKLDNEWGIPSYGPAVGFDMPLTKNSLLSVNGSYQWFTDREYDFNAASLTIAWKRFFDPGKLKNAPRPDKDRASKRR